MLTSIKVSSKSTYENGESKKEFLQLLWWKLEQAWRRQGLAQLGDCGQESQQCWLGVGVEGGLGQQNLQEEQVCLQAKAPSNTGECLSEKIFSFLDLHGISLSVWICLPLELFSKWMILFRCSWIYVNDHDKYRKLFVSSQLMTHWAVQLKTRLVQMIHSSWFTIPKLFIVPFNLIGHADLANATMHWKRSRHSLIPISLQFDSNELEQDTGCTPLLRVCKLAGAPE